MLESREQKDKRNRRNALRVRERQTFLAHIKSLLGCSRCLEKDPDCLDFHHADKSTKLFSVGNTAAYQWKVGPIARLIDEIRKCFILCANCHRKEEAQHRRAIRKHNFEGEAMARLLIEGKELTVGFGGDHKTIVVQLG